MRIESTLNVHPFLFRYGCQRAIGIHKLDLKRSAIASAFLILISFFYATISNAQCVAKSSCRSNAVQVQRVYLGDAAGSPVTEVTCVSGSLITQYHLWMVLSTNTQRQGVWVSGNLKVAGHDPVAFGACHDIALKGATNAIDLGAISWYCGRTARLENVYVTWNTGNTSQCAQANSSCAPNSAQCWQQLPQEIIIVEVPGLAAGFRYTESVCTSGNRTISFTGERSGGSGNYSYAWDLDGNPATIESTDLTTSRSYPAGATYPVTFKVTDNVSGRIETVTENVIVSSCCPTPLAAPTVSKTDPTCNTAGTVTVTSPIGSDYEYRNDGGDFQSSPTFTIEAGDTYYIEYRQKSTGCTSDATSGTMGTGPGTIAEPTLTVVDPICENTDGSVTVTAPTGSNFRYSNDNGLNYQESPVFSIAAGASFSITAKNLTTGCVSSAAVGTMGAGAPNANAGTVSGTTPICIGASGITYTSNGDAGGSWSSSDETVATINASTGAVTALKAGQTTITYTVTGCGSNLTATKVLTVSPNANAGTVSGTTPICIGASGITYTSNGDAGGSWSSSDETGAVTALKAGQTTITYTVTGCGSNLTATKVLTVQGNGTITLTSAAGSNVQTKCVNTAVTNIIYAIGGAATGATASGLPAGVTGSYSNGLFTISGTPTTASSTAYSYTVTTTGSSCVNPSSGGTITVNPNIICGTYSGDYFVSTPSLSSLNAIVTLVYTITGANVTCNNISGLTADDFTVEVKDGNAQEVANSKTYSNGIFTVKYNISIQSQQFASSATFTLKMANSNFKFGECLDVPVVTVALPAGDFVTGGGYIIPPGTTPTCTLLTGITPTSSLKGFPTSFGPYTADGRKNNFGFNIKWNKSMKNLQGNLNTIIRGQDGHSYQVKSSQAASLAVTKVGTRYRADMIFSPVNFQDLTTGTWSDGGGKSSATVTIMDNGEPGAGVDQIFISVKDKYNNLWYSSNVATTTVFGKECTISLLNQGNLQIHTGVTTQGTTRDIQTVATTLGQSFDVTATPNPSFSYFNLNITGNNASGVVNVKVTDVLGRVVEAKQNLAPGQTLRIGSEYKPGVYIVQVMQGDTVKQLKLVKQ
jgi:hypothetical protein